MDSDSIFIKWVLITSMVFGLTFCGDPDIHDLVMQKAGVEKCDCKETTE